MTAERDLVEAARAAREHAHAPYSGFQVGAALRAASGRVYVGANVENASYPVGLCAERSALAAAVVAGERAFTQVVVVTGAARPTPPCGMCRQALAEFPPSFEVLCVTLDGAELRTTVAELLPAAFDRGSLA